MSAPIVGAGKNIALSYVPLAIRQSALMQYSDIQ